MATTEGCYLYIRIRDAAHAAFPMKHTLTEAGDCICVLPKPSELGKQAMVSPDHIYIECPDLGADEATQLFCGEEPDPSGAHDCIRPRVGGFNLARLPKVVRDYITGKPAVTNLSTIKADPAVIAKAALLIGVSGHDAASAAEEVARAAHRQLVSGMTFESVKAAFEAIPIPVVTRVQLLAAYGAKAAIPNPFDSGTNPFDVVLPKPGAK